MNDPRNIVVLGLGCSGEAAAMLLAGEGRNVTVCDSADGEGARAKAAELAGKGVRVLLGCAADTDPAFYDLSVISPGIDPVVPLVQNVVGKGIPMIGELELAFQRCACPVVAITGTNGKTTTTELTEHILRGAGVRTTACGNIGLPFSAAVAGSGALDVIVLEVSSFQLETIETFRPKVSAWLNLSPNHLDRYPGMTEYRAAKLRIFENQTDGDFAVVNAASELPKLAARPITFSATRAADFTLREHWICFQGEALIDQSATRLPGVHNAENIMAAVGIGHALGLDLEVLASAVGNYAPPAHRCEWVRELDGVRWINDSKATNLDSVAMAIRSQERPLILISGGKDKGFEFDDIAPLVRERVRTAVLIGEMRHRIAKSWSGTHCIPCDSLESAVEEARRAAGPGDVVLFSPGTSSFDMFSSYVERGNLFKSLVQKLESQHIGCP